MSFCDAPSTPFAVSSERLNFQCETDDRDCYFREKGSLSAILSAGKALCILCATR